MATATKFPDKHRQGLHIEANGCIINIRENLTDKFGRNVTSIEIIPDKYSGEQRWKRIGALANVRVVQLKKFQ